MDILIRGIEMPNGGYRTIEIGIDADGHPMAIGDDKNVYDVIPIPPHGRCIDADALLKGCERVTTEYATREYAFSQSAIENAPTIIPAELPVHHGTFAATSEQEALKRIAPADDSKLSATIKCGGAVTCVVAYGEEIYKGHADTADSLRWTGTYSEEEDE